MRLAAKRDTVEAEIILALKEAGATNVYQLSHPGLPDLLVNWGGHWRLVECKSPKGKLTPKQRKFFRDNPGAHMTVSTSGDEAVAALRSLA